VNEILQELEQDRHRDRRQRTGAALAVLGPARLDSYSEADEAPATGAGPLSPDLALIPRYRKGPLGNLGTSSERDEETKQQNTTVSKSERIAQLKKRVTMLRFQRTHAVTESIRFCGIHAIPLIGLSPACVISDKGYGWTGLQSCGNRSCVNCAGRAVSGKIDRIKRSIRGAHKEGKTVLFLTLTTKRNSSPKDQIAELRKGWKAVQNRLDYDIKRAGGSYDTVRAVDVTFKPRWGRPYHVHLHCLVIVDLPPGYDSGLDHLCHRIRDGFSRKAWSARISAQDVRIVDRDRGASEYVAKFSGLAYELANPKGKKAQDPNALSLYQLIDQAMEDGDPRLIRVYQDYQRAMKGVKTMSFSRDWDRWQIEESDQEETEPVRIVVSKPWWDLIYRHRDRIGILLFIDVNYHGSVQLKALEPIMRLHPPDLRLFNDWLNATENMYSYIKSEPDNL
jgi:hypothetical protein